MTILVALLVIGSLAAAGSAWGLSRGGRVARLTAVGGVIALILVAILALALDGSPVPLDQPVDASLFDGRLAPNGYLRLVVALWAIDALLITAVAAVSEGLDGLRGVLPATLTAIVGGTLAFAAKDLTLAAAAAGITGLAAMIVLAAATGPGVVMAGARELRVSLLVPALLIAVAAAAPVAASIVLRGVTAGADEIGLGDEAGGAIGLLALVAATVIAMRYGVIPFHVRVPRLSDAVPRLSLPLLLAWIPLPVAVVGLAITDRMITPLALPLDGERLIMVTVVLISLVATALAAFLQDDLRHAVGYLVIADGSLALLGIAAFDSAAWGPARTWIVIVAVSKTALLAWAAVAESRFETRSIPDLRGWIRGSPILAASLVVTIVATFGIPGWRAFTARTDLASLAVDTPWSWVLILAAIATLPTYLRLLVVGAGSATSTVSRAEPERIARAWRPEALPIEREHAPKPTVAGEEAFAPAGGGSPASRLTPAMEGTPTTERDELPLDTDVPAAVRTRSRERASAAASRMADRGRRLSSAIRRDRAILSASAVLALAIVAALTSSGALGIAPAAAEPTIVISTQASD
jgi:NADH:ubiquinone oxidoreductase subunit 2 (subunit N)